MTGGAMKEKQGFTLGGFIVFLFLLIMGALLAFKLILPYVEYFEIQKTFKALAADPALQSGNRREIMRAFDRYADVNNLKAIAGDNIEVSKDGGAITLSADYSVKVPLVANISLLLDFNPTSASR
jgi:hypothetical protein